MSTWEHRGFERRVRMKIARQTMAWNKPGTIAEAILRQNPSLDSELVKRAVNAWSLAACAWEEGTAIRKTVSN